MASPVEFNEDYQLTSVYRSHAVNASKRGIDFLLSFFKFKELKNQTHCEYTGREMNNIPESPDQMTFERIDPKKPYSDENCVAVTLEANRAKNCLDQFEHNDYLTAQQKVAIMTRTLYRLRKEARKEAQAAKKAGM